MAPQISKAVKKTAGSGEIRQRSRSSQEVSALADQFSKLSLNRKKNASSADMTDFSSGAEKKNSGSETRSDTPNSEFSDSGESDSSEKMKIRELDRTCPRLSEELGDEYVSGGEDDESENAETDPEEEMKRYQDQLYEEIYEYLDGMMADAQAKAKVDSLA